MECALLMAGETKKTTWGLEIMPMDGNNVSLSAALQHRFDYLVRRQSAVAGNIANSATPGYLAKDLEFRSLVAAQQQPNIKMSASKGDHLSGQVSLGGKFKETVDLNNIKVNGNSVEMSTEMLKLNEIQVNYRLMTRLYAKHGEFFRMALQGSGR